MTEAEWLTGTGPRTMLEFLCGKASDRQLRLFAAACCRVVWDSITHTRSKQAVEIAEMYSDGLTDDAVLARAHSQAHNALTKHQEVLHRSRRPWVNRDGPTLTERRLALVVQASHTAKPFRIGRLRGIEFDPDVLPASVRLLRCIFGNPFRPVAFSPSWLTATVTALARQMYDSRDFSAMPVLGDALQDAGCDIADILTHCRGDGPHVRGCFVVDLILGKG